MSTNSSDNMDLIGDVPGFDAEGMRSNRPGFEDVNDNEALIARIRKFYDDGIGAFEENRRMHSEDLNFAYNSEAMGQWDPVVLENRRGKPCYTFNRVLGPINLVVGDMRQTKPAGKVRPASDGASEPVAEVFGGLCRAIEQASRAESTYKEQFKYAVAGGFGAWRIMPVYMNDDGDGAFDQVLRLINIANPQTVVWDPECADACAGDANKALVAERIGEDIYHALYKDASGQSFNFSRDSYGWFTDKEVRIAEYFERIPFEKKIALMTDGTVKDYNAELKAVEAAFDAHNPPITAEDHPGVVRVAKDKKGRPRIRSTIKWRVMWAKVDGSNILEGPYVYDWKRIPIVRCPGRYINIEGRKKFQSLIRHSKDAQRSYNSRASDMIERSALIPKAPYLVTETMIKGYENEWNQANVASRPYLPYNIDAKAIAQGGMPHRVEPLDMPQGAIALAQMALQDIQATTGYFDPALGNADDMNRVSGKALVQHTRRSDLGSYEFVDGYAEAIQLTWEMMVDMIPSVYDAERVERTIGHDGIEKLITINQTMDGGDIINDLKKGSYDVTTTIGPSYQTARQETLQALIDASEAIPTVAQFCPDLLVANIDSPDAQEMARRLRIPLIQQGIVMPTESEKKTVPKPPPPDPMIQLEQQLAQAKLTGMSSKNQVDASRAQMSGVEQHKLMLETAGRHLANIKMVGDTKNAAQAGQDAAAAEAQERQQDHQESQQDLQQTAQKHAQAQAQGQQQQQQALQQQAQNHVADLSDQARNHVLDLHRQSEAHRHEVSRTQEKHAQAIKHAEEKHAQALKHAKALAAATPKKPKAA
jgi:hypothetical protein